MSIITEWLSWYNALPYGDSGRKKLNAEQATELLQMLESYPLMQHFGSLFEVPRSIVAPPGPVPPEGETFEDRQRRYQDLRIAVESEYSAYREEERKQQAAIDRRLRELEAEKAREAAVVYEPRIDGMQSPEERAVHRMKLFNKKVPKAKGKAKVRKLPLVPQPYGDWSSLYPFREWKEGVDRAHEAARPLKKQG
jgi:hypothetical protein